MKLKNIKYVVLLMLIILSSCQDRDIESISMKVNGLSADKITGELNGDDYTWTWPAQSDLRTVVSIYNDGTIASTDTVSGNTFTHKNVNTNIPYTYVFKEADGKNISSGTVKEYTREGASSITGLQLSQVDGSDNLYNVNISWDKPSDATAISLTISAENKTSIKTIDATTTNDIVEGLTYGDTLKISIRAINDKGNSLATTGSLLIGKTAMAFLSTCKTPEDLVDNGDDDEASAWLWMHSQYPSAKFLYFGDIKQRSDIDPFRVMFWLRDLESGSESDVWNMPDCVESATPVIKSWYKDGGNLLLWQHAVAYIATLGRLNQNMLQSNDHTISIGKGGINNDTWSIGVQLNAGSNVIDLSSHPIYKGLNITTTSDNHKLLTVKGPGWTEDHNCVFFNIPTILTGMGNQVIACYNEVTQTYGIFPLATWDSQVYWISQLNIWEARQGNTDYKGTVICVGNGGCEFSMKNTDGTNDKSAYPKNNIYEGNVLKLAKNALEYLKTR